MLTRRMDGHKIERQAWPILQPRHETRKLRLGQRGQFARGITVAARPAGERRPPRPLRASGTFACRQPSGGRTNRMMRQHGTLKLQRTDGHGRTKLPQYTVAMHDFMRQLA